jgi:hypothetical protein
MPPLDALVARVRGEYGEMPGLRLTISQACRLWQVEMSTCERLLEQLVREGFLYKTDNGAHIAVGDLSLLDGRGTRSTTRQHRGHGWGASENGDVVL